MGLSLTDIREDMEGFMRIDEVHNILSEKISDVEKEMSALMKRFATLKNLNEFIKSKKMWADRISYT